MHRPAQISLSPAPSPSLSLFLSLPLPLSLSLSISLSLSLCIVPPTALSRPLQCSAAPSTPPPEHVCTGATTGSLSLPLPLPLSLPILLQLQIVTIKVFEENLLVKELMKAGGDERVLVIDGGGSMRSAMVGGQLSQLAENMGWSGILVNGCVRDTNEINLCDIGIRALGSIPRRSSKKLSGETHLLIHIGGTIIRDGEWLYADNDGILISKTELSITPSYN